MIIAKVSIKKSQLVDLLKKSCAKSGEYCTTIKPSEGLFVELVVQDDMHVKVTDADAVETNYSARNINTL